MESKSILVCLRYFGIPASAYFFFFCKYYSSICLSCWSLFIFNSLFSFAMKAQRVYSFFINYFNSLAWATQNSKESFTLDCFLAANFILKKNSSRFSTVQDFSCFKVSETASMKSVNSMKKNFLECLLLTPISNSLESVIRILS